MPYHPIDRWLHRVCAHIRSPLRREAVRQELLDHLNDRIRLLEAQGMTPEQAARQAVASMGDPDAVGRALAAADRPWRRFWSWLVTLFFWAAALFLLLFCVLCLLHVI